jgi:tetratricopeptide (TPR) repeat protein
LVANALLYGGVIAGFSLVLVGAWWVFGPGPRRVRAYNRAQRELRQGRWQDALTIVKALQTGRLSLAWQGRLRSAEGECHHAAAEKLLREKDYEESLRHFQTATELLRLDGAERRSRVVDFMLADVRQQFAACKSATDNQAVQALIARVLRVQSPCPEATFWQGLCHVREGNLEAAMTALLASHEDGGKRCLDPPLYLGTLRIRTGRVQEGLRMLGEANRVESTCPLVSLELGVGMVAANGDSALASRALQRALGPRGLAPLAKQPQRLWTDTFPEGRSYVQRLAARYPFTCPVFGSDVAAIARQGEYALAQAEYRQAHFREAADRYARLLQDEPPSAPLLRGLGLSLARLELYDQAYKHLRAALDMDEAQDPLAAGYLALCGALGRPIRAEDRARNVEWAIGLLGRYDLPGNAEWARINSAVFAAARALEIPVSREDQERLCEALRSVDATDAEAASAYDHLAASFPEAVRPEYAWLYCRAAQLHGVTSSQDMELFGRTFREEDAARAFFAARQWEISETAYTYLERCAAQRPGHFPEEFGPGYPLRGEAMLVDRSEQLEAADHADAALAAADVLARLAPSSVRAHDRLAQLHYRRGDLDRTASFLMRCQELAPADPRPAIKRAIVEQQRGNATERDNAIRHGLDSSRGKQRAAVAYFGARLALASVGLVETSAPTARPVSLEDSPLPTNAGEARAVDWNRAKDLLQIAVKEDPGHVEALAALAMSLAASDDRPGLVELARHVGAVETREARFHYLAAVCHLAADDYSGVLEACRRARATADSTLAVECEYLEGWAHWRLGDDSAAAMAFGKVAHSPSSPSADVARALAAHLAFARRDYDSAAASWQVIAQQRRAEWGLDEPLRQTIFLSALTALHAERFEEAAEKFREGGRLGLRDRRLGSLLTLSLVKAGQQILYKFGDASEGGVNPVSALETGWPE